MPTCEKVTLNPQKRRLHLIDKHGYPREYDFRIVHTGLGKRTSLLKQGRGGAQAVGGRRRRVSDVGEAGWRERNGTTSGSRRSSILQSGVGKPSDESKEVDEGHENGAEAKRDQKMEVDQKPDATSQQGIQNSRAKPEVDMNQLVDGVAALKFIPRGVQLREPKPSS